MLNHDTTSIKLKSSKFLHKKSSSLIKAQKIALNEHREVMAYLANKLTPYTEAPEWHMTS